MQRFVSYDEVDEVAAHGETRATVVLRSGLQVDLRVVPEESYGSALHYSTGSKAHNIAVRSSVSSAASRSTSTASFGEPNAWPATRKRSVYAQVRLPFIPARAPGRPR